MDGARRGDVRWTYLPSKIEVHAQVRIGVGVGAPAREGTSMLKVVHDASASNESAGGSLLDEIVRDGARQMLAAALQAEVAVYIEAFADEVDEVGRRLVVRNGHHGSREVTTAAGAIPVRAPRVNDKRVDPITGFETYITPRDHLADCLVRPGALRRSDWPPLTTQGSQTPARLRTAPPARLPLRRWLSRTHPPPCW